MATSALDPVVDTGEQPDDAGSFVSFSAEHETVREPSSFMTVHTPLGWGVAVAIQRALLFWQSGETPANSTDQTSVSLQNASIVLQVRRNTAGTRWLQTSRLFVWRRGHLRLRFDTTGGKVGTIRRLGLFNEANGFFLEMRGPDLWFAIRVAGLTYYVAQPDWNVRPNISINPFRDTEMWIAYDWRDGDIRFGFIENDKFKACLNMNFAPADPLNPPAVPIRFEITNNGTGERGSLEVISGTIEKK